MSLFPISADKVQLSTDAPVATDSYVGGLLRDAGNTVCRAALSGGVQWSNGLLMTALGQVVIVDATTGLPAGSQYVNGLPISSAGALCVSSDAMANYSSGLPFTANGALASSSVASMLAALFAAKSVIEAGVEDARILAVGDSTGDENSEFIYRFSAEKLVAKYPTHSVEYIRWNTGTQSYDAPVSLSTGSGPRKISIYNASVAGTSPIYHMGLSFSPAIVVPNPHVVLFNYMKNLAQLNRSVQRGEWLGAMDQVRLALPTVPQAAMLQFPNRDDNFMATALAEFNQVATDYGDVARSDSYSPFISQGKNPVLYVDNLHQSRPPASPNGDNLILAALGADWDRSVNVPGFMVAPAFLASTAANLLSGKFYDPAIYSGGTPVSWTAVNAAVGAVDNTIVDAGQSQSLKIVGTAAQAGFNTANLPATSLRGKSVTLAVRQYVPAGSVLSVGQIGVFIFGPNLSYSTVRGAVGNGGWRWFVLSDILIPETATSIRVSLVCDNAANAGSSVNISEVWLGEGRFPRRNA